MSDGIEIACAARRDYLPHTATMLSSVLANAGTVASVDLLIGADVGADDVAPLEEMLQSAGVGLNLIRVDPAAFEGLTTTSTLPAAHWYRTMLPVLLAAERVLYLDSDLLVVDSLDELWRSDLEGNWLAAVTNVFPDIAGADAYCARLGVERSSYFNSGVMLLDLEALRGADSFERVKAFAGRLGDGLILPEQDAMNAVAGAHRLPLHPRWNLMVGIERFAHSADAFGEQARAEAIASPAVRHFEGSSNKPWDESAPESVRELWNAYASRARRLRV